MADLNRMTDSKEVIGGIGGEHLNPLHQMNIDVGPENQPHVEEKDSPDEKGSHDTKHSSQDADGHAIRGSGHRNHNAERHEEVKYEPKRKKNGLSISVVPAPPEDDLEMLKGENKDVDSKGTISSGGKWSSRKGRRCMLPGKGGRLSLHHLDFLEVMSQKSDSKELKRYLDKYEKAQEELGNVQNAYIAKFKLDPRDYISLAFLAASNPGAAFAVLIVQAVPLIVIVLLVLYVAATEANYTGPELIQDATNLEVSIVLLTLGIFYTATLLGPVTRPYTVLLHFGRLIGCCCGFCGRSTNGVLFDKDGEYDLYTRGQMSRGAMSLAFRNILATGVIIISGVVAVLFATNIVGLLWTALALTWLSQIDVLILSEVFYHFYSNATVTVAVEDLKWDDPDTEREFWKSSWTSKTQIMRGLRNLDRSPQEKWMLLTHPYSGLGLGSLSSLAPVSCRMTIKLVNWGEMNSEDIKALGPVVASGTQDDEWIYQMSLKQQRRFFELYPIRASQLEWAGSVNLGHLGFRTEHSVGVARLLMEEHGELDPVYELYLNDNAIGEEGTFLIAEALRENLYLESLYMHDNKVQNQGAASLADALKDNENLKVLHLRNNKIGDLGAEAIASMLKTNTTIREIGLDKNNIGMRGIRKLVDVLRHHNKTLVKLWLNKNLANVEDVKNYIGDDASVRARISIEADTITPVIRNRIHERLKRLNVPFSRQTKLLSIWNNVVKKGKTERRKIAETLGSKRVLTPRAHDLSKEVGEEIREDEIETIIQAVREDEEDHNIPLSRLMSEYAKSPSGQE